MGSFTVLNVPLTRRVKREKGRDLVVTIRKTGIQVRLVGIRGGRFFEWDQLEPVVGRVVETWSDVSNPFGEPAPRGWKPGAWQSVWVRFGTRGLPGVVLSVPCDGDEPVYLVEYVVPGERIKRAMRQRRDLRPRILEQ